MTCEHEGEMLHTEGEEIKEMDTNVKLVVAPVAEVRKDLFRNWPWLLGLVAVTILYVTASAFVLHKVETWSFLHACYFTVINVTTVGFGDVVPVTHMGKVIAGINGLVGLLLFGSLVAVATLALQPAGWSAALTAKNTAETADKSTRSQDDRIVADTASVLESLANLIRTAEHRTGEQPHARGIFIHVRSNVPGRADIHVGIHIDVN